MQLLNYSHRSLSSSKTHAAATVDLVITPSWLSQGANPPLRVVGLVTLSNRLIQDDYRQWDLPQRKAAPVVAPRATVPFNAETSYHDTYHAHPLEAPVRHQPEVWKGKFLLKACAVFLIQSLCVLSGHTKVLCLKPIRVCQLNTQHWLDEYAAKAFSKDSKHGCHAKNCCLSLTRKDAYDFASKAVQACVFLQTVE